MAGVPIPTRHQEDAGDIGDDAGDQQLSEKEGLGGTESDLSMAAGFQRSGDVKKLNDEIEPAQKQKMARISDDEITESLAASAPDVDIALAGNHLDVQADLSHKVSKSVSFAPGAGNLQTTSSPGAIDSESSPEGVHIFQGEEHGLVNWAKI